ncbi:uncharacterized protein BO97DRAFT_478219 [Aspergillus homomorphus CBS 101889]|uniref:DUF1365-domain-containing protein n=1 Tax=Aspergillus homomorphus (strain CBS 101889) TaxID=1450537 RepID=A0A395HWG1_ASPHC|nr:hypothetical protein BO97DRAFT_478219 [Aspergillus homomorphus CBS 101889]RAL11765.1 hypothetical protein BO97DRAFT_478219 [Aspergillus homomorphus CBS 101889]
MSYQDLLTLALYSSLRHQNAAFLLKCTAALGALLLLTPLLVLLFMLLRLFFVSHKLVSLSDEPQTILGKPLLFPMQLSHVRFNPIKDQFTNRFLMVGVPVGLRCRFGNLLAIDDKRLTLKDSTLDGPSWKSFLAQATCWLTIDGERYLHRGDQDLDLRAKLDRYLQKENEDPSQWPYAYMLSVPRFFWWSRSVVTWWYLYNAERELDAVIMEINNSYDEKRNYFFRVERGENTIPAAETDDAAEKRFLDDSYKVRTMSSKPTSTFYKGTWQKFIFASPFEKVDGAIANRFMDLAHESAWKPNATLLNTNTLSPAGKVKMITRMTSCGPPLDPSQMTVSDTALRIRFRGLMKMMDKTPVRSGSIGRHPTKTERKLEPFFRAYLSHCVSVYPDPVELVYIPCRAFSDETIRMKSPSCIIDGGAVRTVTIEVLDPSFYTRIVDYLTAWEGLPTEMKATDQEADRISHNIAVSDPALLQTLVNFHPSQKTEEQAATDGFAILRWCRWRSRPSFMDTFVANTQTPSTHRVYSALVARYLLAQQFAFDSPVLLTVFHMFGGLVLRSGVLEITFQNRKTDGTPMENAVQTLASVAVYFVTMRVLSSRITAVFQKHSSHSGSGPVGLDRTCGTRTRRL